MQDLLVRSRPARCQRSSCLADIGAVEIKPDTLLELNCIWLGDTGVRARGAGLGTSVASLNTCNQRLADASFHIRMGRNHLAYMHGALPGKRILASINQAAAAYFQRMEPLWPVPSALPDGAPAADRAFRIALRRGTIFCPIRFGFDFKGGGEMRWPGGARGPR